jgi:hypothetical protein
MAPATTLRFVPISRITRSVSVMPDSVPAMSRRLTYPFGELPCAGTTADIMLDRSAP